MSHRSVHEDLPGMAWSVLLPLAVIHALAHIFTNGNYGMFRDEFYYIACAGHLDWGYVDHPPLSIALLAFSDLVLGTSVHAVRVVPALCGAALVVLAGFLAREMGGRAFAQALAAIAVAISPAYLVVTGFYSMNSLDLVFWALAYSLMLRIARKGSTRLWIALGLLLGLGLMNKISVLFLGFGLAVGMILTPLRRNFLSGWFWLGGALALGVFLPYVLWQIPHGWPTLEFMNNARTYKISDLSAWEFLGGTMLDVHPWNLPILLAGLVWLLFGRSARRFRFLAFTFLAILTLLLTQKSKTYYLAPAYLALLAAGALAFESLFDRRWTRARPVIIVLLVVGGLIGAPFALPLLPPEHLIGYQRALGIDPPASETNKEGSLPPYFADRFGWEDMTRAVWEVYSGLSEEEQAECVIFARNYGEAGAIDYYGKEYGLPPVISAHNSYFLWGPGSRAGNVAIVVGVSRDLIEDVFDHISAVPTDISPYAMPYEIDAPVFLCRGLRVPLEVFWFRTKMYI